MQTFGMIFLGCVLLIAPLTVLCVTVQLAHMAFAAYIRYIIRTTP